MKKKAYMLALALSAIVVVALTGCGERATVETETEKKTEAVTEVHTEPETQTEKVTETEKPTEKITEKVTEAETFGPEDLPVEEELANEKELPSPVVYVANDNINVRESPTTEEENVISSFDEGEEVTVLAKTPHWYKIEKEDYTGYVHKDGLDGDEDEGPAAPAPQQPAGEESAPAGQEEEHEPEQQEEEPVQTVEPSDYAESYPIEVAEDANIRASASDTGEVLQTVAPGTQLTALGEEGDWIRVDYDGAVGYIHRNLIG